MSTLLLQGIKRKASDLIESRLLKTGSVLEVRLWENATIIEIDLHLPHTAMCDWKRVPYIKFQVAEFTYRDYTPSGWDAETRTCTIYVDATHNGPGSRWAQQLQTGSVVNYLKVEFTQQSPSSTDAVVCLGDESSIGHLLAMQQLTMPSARFTGAVVMSEQEQCQQFKEYFRTPLEPIERTDEYGHHTLMQWLLQQAYHLNNTIFYLSGNTTMVVQLRKLLKQQGFGSGQIKAQGFWS